MLISSLQIYRLHKFCASQIFLNPTSDLRVFARKLQPGVLLSMTERGGSGHSRLPCRFTDRSCPFPENGCIDTQKTVGKGT